MSDKKKKTAGVMFRMNSQNHPAIVTEHSPTELHAVFYTDGGCRPSSRGTAGWGVHGYLYHDVPAKQGTGGGVFPTPMGYDETRSGKPDITIVSYWDVFGAIPDSTNNYAEVLALIKAFEYAIEKKVVSITIRADSLYTLTGHAQWMYGWDKANWVGRDGTATKNGDLWRRVLELQRQLVALGVSMITEHVAAHTGETGNEKADHLATCGVVSGFNQIYDVVAVESDPRGYWSSDRTHNRMLAHPYWYLSTAEGALTTLDGYSLYVTGTHTRDEMELVGKAIATTGMAILMLKEPDPALEVVRSTFNLMRCGRYQGLVIGDLTNAVKPKTYNNLSLYNSRLTLIDDPGRRVTMGYDDSLLGQEVYPPGLSFRWMGVAEEMLNILQDFRTGAKALAIPYDITDILYEQIAEGAKAPVVKLRPEIKSGVRSLQVNVPITTCAGGVTDTKLTLNMGQDIPERNTLSALADTTTKVTLLVWEVSAAAIRYATVVESNGDIGLWVGPYSNLKLMSSQKPKK